MKKQSFFNRVRAAHALSIAMADGTEPNDADLAALGLPREFNKGFKR